MQTKSVGGGGDDGDGDGGWGAVFAYFLIPLPEPLGIPSGLPMRFTEERAPKHFGDLKAESQHGGGDLESRTRIVSTIFHHIKQDSMDGLGLDPVMVLAKRVLPWAVEGDFSSSAQETPVVESDDDFPPVPDVTVVEAACLVDDSGDMEDELTKAFDHCLETIRGIQRAYYLVRRHPITLCARESLPVAVPYAVGRFEGPGLPKKVTGLSMFMLNTNVWAHVRESDMSDDELGQFRFALTHVGDEHAFLTYLECRREAWVAGSRRGDYRTAAILAATAAEALLDDLLLQLMWEESVRPEEAADVFERSRNSVAKRVSSEYAKRLGGTWDAARPGPIADWANDVARLRHRAVHGGYIPDREKVLASQTALEGLEQFIASRLTEQSRLSRYPRTAMSLLGEPGLRRRGLWRGKVKRVAKDPNEPIWGDLYRRWKETFERILLDLQSANPALPPTMDESLVVLVVDPSGSRKWTLHDRRLHQAALIEDPDLSEFPAIRDSLDTAVDAMVKGGLPESVTIQVDLPLDQVVVSGEWRHEYRMIPGARVLLNGLDLD